MIDRKKSLCQMDPHSSNLCCSSTVYVLTYGVLVSEESRLANSIHGTVPFVY